MIPYKSITGIILAGGQSQRMGTDKAGLPWEGKSFLEHIAAQLRPVVGELIISGNHAHHDAYGIRRIPDLQSYEGPLCGILSSIQASETPYQLIVSCDNPLLSRQVLEGLLAEPLSAGSVRAYSIQEAIQPFPGLYHKEIMHPLAEVMNRGERSIRKALNSLSLEILSLPAEQELFFKNINTPQDYNTLITWK